MNRLVFLHLNDDAVTVRCTLIEAHSFVRYLVHCDREAFSGSNDYRRTHPVTETLHRFNAALTTSAFIRAILRTTSRHGKPLRVKIDYGQRVTLSVIFKRVDTPPDIQSIQQQITNHLTY